MPAYLSAILNVTVGGSAAYAGRSWLREITPMPAEGVNGQPMVRKVWTIECMAVAVDADARRALREQIEADLAKVGQAVVVTELGSTSTMAAGGTLGGSMLGYPRCTVRGDESQSFGSVVSFTLVAETIEAIDTADPNVPVQHEYATSKATDPNGDIVETTRGKVTVNAGESAETFLENNVFAPAEAQATLDGRDFSKRLTVGTDASVAEYEHTTADRGGTPFFGVTEASVRDITARNNNGRTVRTVSGSARGGNVPVFIDSVKPEPDAENILTRDDVSEPSIPDGTVNFTFEVVTGFTSTLLPNVKVISFREEISDQEGIAQLTAVPFLGAAPSLRYTRIPPTTYSVRTTVEFVGNHEDAIPPAHPSFSGDNEVLAPRISKRSQADGIRVVTVERTYLYDAPLSPQPDPREIGALA